MRDLYYDPYDVAIDADPYPTYKRLRDEALVGGVRVGVDRHVVRVVVQVAHWVPAVSGRS